MRRFLAVALLALVSCTERSTPDVVAPEIVASAGRDSVRVRTERVPVRRGIVKDPQALAELLRVINEYEPRGQAGVIVMRAIAQDRVPGIVFPAGDPLEAVYRRAFGLPAN